MTHSAPWETQCGLQENKSSPSSVLALLVKDPLFNAKNCQQFLAQELSLQHLDWDVLPTKLQRNSDKGLMQLPAPAPTTHLCTGVNAFSTPTLTSNQMLHSYRGQGEPWSC